LKVIVLRAVVVKAEGEAVALALEQHERGGVLVGRCTERAWRGGTQTEDGPHGTLGGTHERSLTLIILPAKDRPCLAGRGRFRRDGKMAAGVADAVPFDEAAAACDRAGPSMLCRGLERPCHDELFLVGGGEVGKY
jgi:hypothetical protein